MLSVMHRPLRASLLALAAVAALANTAPPNAEFVQAQQANKAAMREYTWKSRTQLALKGEIKKVTLEQVRFDLDSRLQKTQIGGSSEGQTPMPAPGPIGPIKQRVIKKKKEEFKELMADLGGLVAAYANLPQDRLQAYAAQASLSKGLNTVQLRGRGVLKGADSMAVWIDPTSYMLRRVEIVTDLEMKPVDLTADYRSLDNGLTYQARAVLRYPEKQIELTVENFEYQHVGVPR